MSTEQETPTGLMLSNAISGPGVRPNCGELLAGLSDGHRQFLDTSRTTALKSLRPAQRPRHDE